MTRTSSMLALLTMTFAASSPQTPPIQNGRVETRQPAAGLERELTALASGAVEAVWAAWRVPIAEGQRAGCCTYGDEASVTRGCFVDNTTLAGRPERPQTAPPAGAPVQLEAGSGLVVLVRLVDRHVERLRTLADDCPLDASGRTVYWIQGVAPADSVRFLDGLIQRPDPMPALGDRRLQESALSAVALHRDPAADAVLDRMAKADGDSNARRLARSLLGSTRGAHGFMTLQQLLEQERLPDIRRQLVAAIGQTRQPATPAVLLDIARHDWDSKVRAEAAYWLPQRGGMRVIPDVAAIADTDPSDTVKQRAIQGIGRLPAEDSTPVLIQLARTSASSTVRRAAVSALGRSKDPRAVAFLEELIRKM